MAAHFDSWRYIPKFWKNRFLLLALLVHGAILVCTISPGTYLWWDECTQQLTAKQILVDPGSFREFNVVGWHLESFRPHLLPWLLALLGGSGEAGILLVSLFALTETALLFLTVREEFGEEAAFIAAIVALTFFDGMLYSVRLYNDIPGNALVLLSIYAMQKKNIPASGIFFGLSVMMRYTSVWAVFPLAAIVLRDGRGAGHVELARRLFLFLGISLAATLPQFLVSDMLEYGVPFTSIIVQLLVSFDAPPVAQQFYYLWKLWADNPLASVLLIIGLIPALRKGKLLFPAWLLGNIIFLDVLMVHKEPRYIISFIPSIAAIAGFGVVSLACEADSAMKRASTRLRHIHSAPVLMLVVTVACLALCWGQIPLVQWEGSSNNPNNLFVENLSSSFAGEPVATNYFAPIACHSNSTVYYLPVSEDEFREVTKKVEFIAFIHSPYTGITATRRQQELMNRTAQEFAAVKWIRIPGHDEEAVIYQRKMESGH